MMPTSAKACQSAAKSFGFLFDIDGVIARGKQVLPHARRAFKRLTDENGRFRVPTVFVTNAGNSLRSDKAKRLSEWLGVQVTEDQMIMSHSPLRLFKHFHRKHMLISGQGPVLEIARNLGFTRVSTIDSLCTSFPTLDMVDHRRRRCPPCAFEAFFPKIEGVVLFGEPVRWETHLQLIVDVLMTNGQPSGPLAHELPYPHIPVLACNMDLLWMSECKMPRFGHGTFLVCLESLYKKLSGRELTYTALVGKPSEMTFHYAEQVLGQQAGQIDWETPVQRLYCVGDNPETDILGANLFNEYLQTKHKEDDVTETCLSANRLMPHSNRDINGNTVPDVSTDFYAESCQSILVETGIFSRLNSWDYNNELQAEKFNHAHRDFAVDPELRKPTHVVKNVLDAVELAFEQESFT